MDYSNSTDLDLELLEIDKDRRDLDRKEYDIIQEAMLRANNNKTKAGRLLGISRYTVMRRLRRLMPNDSAE